VADIRQAFESPFVQSSGKIITLPCDKSPKRTQVQFMTPPFSFAVKYFADFEIG
jgi:hypothetical protein